MKFLLVICSLLAVTTAATAQELSCLYYSYGTIYECELTINNPNGWNNFTEIGGTHLTGFSDANVISIYRRVGYSSNIPQIICDTFPNINLFEFYNGGLTEIDDNAFSSCSNITRLYLYFNQISSISENAFINLRNVSYIALDDNRLTTLPENVFANQQNMTDLSLSYNLFNDFPNNLFRPLENLEYLSISSLNLTEINSLWLTGNPRLVYLTMSANRITLSPNSFAGLEQLRYLGLGYNGISEIPSGTFVPLPNLQILDLFGNNFTVIGADAFQNLSQLTTLDLSSNPITEVDDQAFRGLGRLMNLYLSRCRLRELNFNSFQNLVNLTSIDLDFNELEHLPEGAFASNPNLTYIGLYVNRLKTLRRNTFGSLTQLRTLDLDNNIVNAVDRAIIDDAVNLNTLYFGGNLCASNFFGNFQLSRAQYLPMLERCFRNMRYIVDTTTGSDGVYAIFEAPQPGVVVRVRSDNEVQIALTPFDFLWTPSVEIFIGSTNNTRSVIRINEETDVVTVPSQNIIQQNQWNDFRISWANQNVLVFRGNETYPFMSYTMQQFFPVNFYGLRAVETSATWSVQPID